MKQPDFHPEDKASLFWIVIVYSAIAGIASFLVIGVGP
jgi:hypothetical protein